MLWGSSGARKTNKHHAKKDALSKLPLLVVLLNVCLLEERQIFTPLVTNQIK